MTKPLTGPELHAAAGRPRRSPASGYPLLVQGATGADVALAQKVIGVTADGRFGPVTAAALGVLADQARRAATQEARQRDLVEDGRPQAHPAALPPARAVRQRRAQARARPAQPSRRCRGDRQAVVDGSYGPLTEARVKEYQKSKGLTVTGVTDAARSGTPLMGKTTTDLDDTDDDDQPAGEVRRPHPAAVVAGARPSTALQKAIGRLTVDGSYGPLTEARVKEYQKSKGLPVTGVTDAKVWKALMAPTTPPRRRTRLRP